MRVMHLVKTSVGAHWVLSQIEVLVRQGVEVHVVLVDDGPMRVSYEAAGAVVHLMPSDVKNIGLWRLPAALIRFRRLVTSIAPDLIHSHFVGTTLFMRLSLRRFSNIPRIFQVPGPLHLESFFPRIVELSTATPLDYWIATCRYTADLYSSHGVPSDRIFLSYYGKNVRSFIRPQKAAMTRIELNISPQQKIIGMVSYMYPPRRWLGHVTGIKGHEDLIEAIKILRDEGRDVVALFVGGRWGDAVWYEQQVREYGAERLGRAAQFLGTRNDVPALYEVLDVAVHPSHSENVGGAAESLLLGVPTVTTRVGGFTDVVIDGVTGFLASPKNPHSLAAAIAKMLDNPNQAKQMAKEGRQLCADLFDAERTGREVVNIYHNVLRHRAELV